MGSGGLPLTVRAGSTGPGRGWPGTGRLGDAADRGADGRSPPRARLSYRVGVVGHRPNRLPQKAEELAALADRLKEVLAAVAAAVAAVAASPAAHDYDAEPLALSVISPLAEGVDRMLARAGLDLGYELLCPMPRRRADYADDFVEGEALEADSLDNFNALLAEAGQRGLLTTFELDSSDPDDGDYAAAARIVLNQSDLLVAVWDGEPAQGAGSTVDTIREAIGFNVPVLCIGAHPPFAWRWLGDDDAPPPEGDLAASVASVVRAELLPPGNGQAAHARAYFAERWHRFNRAFVWKAFRNLVGESRVALAPFRVPPLDRLDGWPAVSDGVGVSDVGVGVMARFDARLRQHFGWADRLAERYADAHRSAVVVTSLFAALAVFLALLPVALGWGAADHGRERIVILCELAVMLVILANFGIGHRRRWHERWLEYRTLAEMVRQLRLLAPLGGARPLPRGAAHLAVYGEPTRSWMYWQLRAIARDARLPQAVIDRHHLDRHLATLGDVVAGQIVFHDKTAARAGHIRHRLHRATFVLVALTIACVFAHLFVLEMMDHETSHSVANWLVLVSAVAPALGAALANINNQGEFTRLAKRSQAMSVALAGFDREIANTREDLAREQPPGLAAVTALTDRLAAAMLHEVVDWRVIVVDLPMAPA